MTELVNKIKSWFIQNDGISQIVVWIVTPFFLSSLPVIAFLVFMYESGFFSYDFFINGALGLNTFFVISAFTIFVYGLFSSGLIILVVAKILKYIEKKDLPLEEKSCLGFLIELKGLPLNEKFFLGFLVLLNGGFEYSLFTADFNHDAHIFLTLIGIAVNLHIGMLIFASGKYKLFSLMVLISAIFFSITNFHKTTSELVQLGLKNFNTGGNPKVVISDESNNSNTLSMGELILLSPENIYIRTSNGIDIMGRSNKILKLYKDNNDTK